MVRRKIKTAICCQEETIHQYAGVLYHLYDEIIEIDVNKNEAQMILYTKEKPDIPSEKKEIDEFFREMAEHLVAEEDRDAFLQTCNYRLFCKYLENQERVCLEYREALDGQRMGWVQAELIPVDKYKILFLVKEIQVTAHKLFKSIIDQLIFIQNDQHSELDEDEKNLLLKNAMEEAKTDSLTKLYNQKAMQIIVKHRLEMHRQGAIIFIDLDNFKLINDRYGHITGDQVLKQVAKGFCRGVSSEDLVGRIGGDEFLLFITGDQYSSQEKMEAAVRDVCWEIQRSVRWASELESLTCSMGVAFYPVDGTEYGILVDRADQALYHAKNKGKNQYVFYGREK